MIKFTLNDRALQVKVEPHMPLLWVLRDMLNMTGTKYGCGTAQCGACTVHVDGEAMRSCVLPASAVAGKNVTTIEGLAHNGRMHPVQKAWIDLHVPQCGYCQSGQIMTVVSLLKKKPHPSDLDIDQALTNVCPCGTHARLRQAIHTVATQRSLSRERPAGTVQATRPARTTPRRAARGVRAARTAQAAKRAQTARGARAARA